MNARVVLAIARKDILDAIRNSYILAGLIMPVGLWVIFRVMFGGDSPALTMGIAVYDPAHSQLVAALSATPGIKLLSVSSPEALPREVEQNAVGGIDVPPRFDAAVKAGENPELTVYVNRKRGGGEITAFQELVRQQVWALAGENTPARLSWINVALPAGLAGTAGFGLDRYLLVLCLVMGVVMAGVFVVPTLLVEEKEKHTLDALLVSPARPRDVIAGKALAGLFYSLLGAGLFVLLNQGWSGDWPVTLSAILLGALFAVLFGLFMGALFRTAQQVNTWSSLAMLVLLIPSWTGVIALAGPIETALRVIPTYYMVQALSRALAGEANLAAVWTDLSVLVASVVLMFGAVVWALRREQT